MYCTTHISTAGIGLSARAQIRVSLRPIQEVAKTAPANIATEILGAPVARKARQPQEIHATANMVPAEAPDAGLPKRAPREVIAMRVLQFDPSEYLPPSDVELVALPVNENLFDILPLSGNEPGYWLVRLFIDQDGKVDELQLVESKATERNTDELRAVLLANRFMPALREDSPVKSQKLLEFSFEPGLAPQLSVPVPAPWATEK